MLNHKFVLLIFQQLVQRYSYNCNISKNVTLCSTRGCRIMPSAMPPRVTIMPNYAELCYYADYAAPMQLCRFIMLASRGMPKRERGRALALPLRIGEERRGIASSASGIPEFGYQI